MSKGNNFLALLACIGLFNFFVVIAQLKFNSNIAKEVKELSIAVKSYSDRFVARDKDNIIVLTPTELVFKLRGEKSLRLHLKKKPGYLYLRAKPTK